jgi:monoamine oxidase
MYDPPLSGIRDQLTQRLPNGSAMKAFFIYDKPFWRAEGFNGQLISDVGPARMSNDTCIPGDDHGVILLFLEGDEARTVGRLPQAERRAAMTAELVRHYGEKAATRALRRRGVVDKQRTREHNANHGPHVLPSMARPHGYDQPDLGSPIPPRWAPTRGRGGAGERQPEVTANQDDHARRNLRCGVSDARTPRWRGRV